MILWWQNDKWVGKKDLALVLMACGRFAATPRIMEVGLWEGGWSLHVAKNVGAPTVTAIDPYPGLESVRTVTKERFESLGVALNLFEDWSELDSQGEFDLVHIDGEHSEDAALRDLEESAERLASGGMIVVDDWLQPAFIGVNSAVHRFCARSGYRVILTTEWKCYLASAATADFWREYFLSQLQRVGSIPYETKAEGLGAYSEARTVLGSAVIVALGKPTSRLVDSTGTDRIPSGPVKAALHATRRLFRTALRSGQDTRS
jgi:SAM-dependent methyltransferase